jgi:hypothetical protein
MGFAGEWGKMIMGKMIWGWGGWWGKAEIE